MKKELLFILFFSILFQTAEISAQLIDYIDDESWNDTSWVKSGKETYSYDASGYLVSTVYQMYLNNNYSNPSQIKYSYNKSGKPETITYLNWTSNEWKANTKALYTYDSNGFMTSKTIIVSFDEGASWDSFTRETFTNDSTGNPVQSLFQRWMSNEYRDKEKTIYTCNSSGKITSTTLAMMGSNDWYDFMRTTYTYNDSGQVINEKTATWRESDSTWHDISQKIYAIGLNEQPSIVIEQDYQSGTWVNKTRSTYTYQKAVGIRDEEAPASIFDMFPNPAAEIIYLTLKNESELKEITISDLSGMVIRKIHKYDSMNGIDISDIPSGAYYLTLITGTGSQTRKLIKG